MSRKSAAVGTGAIAFSPLVDMLTVKEKESKGTGGQAGLDE